MNEELLLAFPLLIPLNAEFTAFHGYITVAKEDIPIAIELPSNGDVRNAKIQGHWRLQYLMHEKSKLIKQVEFSKRKNDPSTIFLKGEMWAISTFATGTNTDPPIEICKDFLLFAMTSLRLALSPNLKSFLMELQNLLEQELLSKQSMCTYHFTPSYYTELLRQIEKLDWSKIAFINDSFNVVSIRETDTSAREHVIRLELPANYPKNHPKCVTDLPVDFELKWNESSCLNDVYEQFSTEIVKFQEFWDVMDEIDQNTWVLEPEKPSRKDLHRRLAISTCASVQVTLNPSHPLALPQCCFLGSDQAIAPLRENFNSNLDNWNCTESILQNLQSVLEVTFPSRQLTNKEDFVLTCAICYAYHLNDTIPNKTCDDTRCQQPYHTICLYEWLKALPTSRQSFNVIFGECPYCSKPISCKIPRVR